LDVETSKGLDSPVSASLKRQAAAFSQAKVSSFFTLQRGKVKKLVITLRSGYIYIHKTYNWAGAHIKWCLHVPSPLGVWQSLRIIFPEIVGF
jgi:hypothetical protein